MSVASKGFPEASPAEMTSRAALFTAASLVSMLTSGLSLFVERSSATTTRHSVSTWAGVLRVRLVFMVLFSSIVAGRGNAQDRGHRLGKPPLEPASSACKPFTYCRRTDDNSRALSRYSPVNH